MKKIIVTIASIFLFLPFLSAQQYNVRLNLPVNVKVPVNATTFTETEISVPGQGLQKQNQTQKNELVFSIVEKKGDNYIINCVINKYTLTVSDGGKETTYSSDDKEENMYNKEMKKLTGKVVQAEITPYFDLVGEPKSITEGLNKTDAKDIYSVFDQLFSGLYSEKPLEQGKSIELTKKDSKSKGKMTLSNVNDLVFVLDQNWNISEDFQGLPMTGIASISYQIHRETGIPLSGLVTLPLEGSMATPNGIVSVKVRSTTNFEFIQ